MAPAQSARTPFTASPFPPLQLSLEDEEALEQLSRVILRNYVSQYEQFECASRSHSGGQRTIDERAWKLVKQLEGVRAFVQRKPRGRKSSSSDGGLDGEDGAAALRDTIASYAQSGVVAPAELPEMLIVGSVPGSLDDVMYGLLGPDIDAVRVRTAYIDDNIIDAAILKTFAVPSVSEPFRSFVIKWVHNDTSHGYLRAVVSDRDFVYFERTGVAETSSGERLGFHLLHSVHFPQTHELPGLVRGNTSICGLYRTSAAVPNQVEMYVRTIVDAGGSIVRPVVVLSAADAHIAVAKFIECATRKKLAWQLRTSRRVRKRTVTHDSVSSTSSSFRSERSKSVLVDALSPSQTQAKTLPGTCTVCSKTTSRAMELLGRQRTCALCESPICSSCRIKKPLAHMSSRSKALEQRKFAFCCVCYGDVSRLSAFVVAQQEAAAHSSSNDSLSAWSDYASSISSE